MSIDRRVHAEAVADVRGQLERGAQRRAVGLDRRALAADVEAEAGELHSRGDDVLDEQLRLGGVGAELRRQVRLGGRIAERQPHQDLDVAGPARELLRLDRIVDDERADARR